MSVSVAFFFFQFTLLLAMPLIHALPLPQWFHCWYRKALRVEAQVLIIYLGTLHPTDLLELAVYPAMYFGHLLILEELAE
jgi:hypothetical protein